MPDYRGFCIECAKVKNVCDSTWEDAKKRFERAGWSIEENRWLCADCNAWDKVEKFMQKMKSCSEDMSKAISMLDKFLKKRKGQ